MGTVSHDPGDLHVMTFNLRYASPDGPHSWPARRPVVGALLGSERPDLIGTQEGLADQLDDVRADLGPGYAYVGTGRDGERLGEFTAIFYRIGRLTPLCHGVFWLSDTPEVVGSNTWGGRCVRMATWARFLDAATGQQFHAVNTHFDHVSGPARMRSAALVRDRIAAFEPELPVVLTGDFNADADSPAYRLLTAHLVDAWATAVHRGPNYSTWHGFGPVVVDGPRIDWILVTPDIAVEAAAVNPFRVGDRFPSDHLPVQARLRLPRARVVG